MKHVPHGSERLLRDANGSAAYLPAAHSLYHDREAQEDVEENAQPRQFTTGEANEIIPYVDTVQPPDLEYVATQRLDPFRTSPLGNLPPDVLEECLHYSPYSED